MLTISHFSSANRSWCLIDNRRSALLAELASTGTTPGSMSSAEDLVRFPSSERICARDLVGSALSGSALTPPHDRSLVRFLLPTPPPSVEDSPCLPA
jgi:hypothetical protein